VLKADPAPWRHVGTKENSGNRVN